MQQRKQTLVIIKAYYFNVCVGWVCLLNSTYFAFRTNAAVTIHNTRSAALKYTIQNNCVVAVCKHNNETTNGNKTQCFSMLIKTTNNVRVCLRNYL